jgi:hypothetical protein
LAVLFDKRRGQLSVGVARDERSKPALHMRWRVRTNDVCRCGYWFVWKCSTARSYSAAPPKPIPVMDFEMRVLVAADRA